jgi:hypothetical protein
MGMPGAKKNTLSSGKGEYFVKWKGSSHCPSLVDEKTGAPVPVEVTQTDFVTAIIE